MHHFIQLYLLTVVVCSLTGSDIAAQGQTARQADSNGHGDSPDTRVTANCQVFVDMHFVLHKLHMI